jgi:integrase
MSDKPPKPPKRLFKNDKWNETFHHFISSISNTTTRYQYDKTLRRFFAFITKKYGRETTPDKIVQADIEAFLQQPVTAGRGHRAGEPISPFTHNAYCMALRAFYSYCSRTLIEWRGKQVPILRTIPPTAHIKLAKTGDVERDMTEDEIKKFFACIDRSTLIGKRDYALFWAFLITGRRRMEITNLLRGDLEYGNFMTDDGQMRKGWRFHFRAKWRVTRESAEMDVTIIEALKDFHQAAERNFTTMDPNQPLFPGICGPANHHKPMKLDNADKRFRIYARAAGIDEQIVLHSFRWENAYQRALANGNNLIKVADELGWKSVDQAVHYIRRRKKKLAGDPTSAAIAAKFAQW